jgi:alkylation response protein AidB-like acyl-CoA dehydrogenase
MTEKFLDAFLNDESRLVIKTVDAFCAANLRDSSLLAIEKTDEIPVDIIEAAKKLNLCGLRVPSEFGGVGADLLTASIVLETIASYSLPVSVYFDETLFVEPVAWFGSVEQKQKYLSAIARDGYVTTSAMTEDIAGTDILGIGTKAERRGDRWVLNGSKTFITLGDQAEFFLIFAKTQPGRTRESLTAFLAQRGLPGLRIGKRIEKMGQRGAHANELQLENLELGDENVLGKVGEGYQIALDSYEAGRIAVASQALGLAEGMLKKSAWYASNRSAFERKISKFQLIQAYLAEMDTLIEASRGLVYRAAISHDPTKPSELPSIAKYFATEASTKVAHMAVRIHGALGVASEVGIERGLRDSVLQEIYEGTNEVQKLIIGRFVSDKYGQKG